MKKKSLIFLFLAGLLCTCIDPYKIKFNQSENLLVVDALLTDQNESYTIKLSRTKQIQNHDLVFVTGATVSIGDDQGNIFPLNESSPGIYKTDSLQITGKAGNTYILSIQTQEGDQYVSEPCLMYPVSEIENVYFDKDQEILNNGTQIQNGIRIFLDSENNEGNSFLRWAYDEAWKIIVPAPKKYDYINDSTFHAFSPIKQTCWGINKSDEIIIQAAGYANRIEKKPIAFISTDQSNRFLIRYSIDVKQFSVSPKEYEFWNQLNQITESGGDIFEKQPFPVLSNVHNINDPGEPVLGYFQVSSVSSKRIYINNSQITPLNIPVFTYDCQMVIKGPDDYPPPLFPGDGMSFSKIYNLYSGPQYTFVEPIFNGQGELMKLVFSKNVCADCTLTGILTKPDFWID